MFFLNIIATLLLSLIGLLIPLDSILGWDAPAFLAAVITPLIAHQLMFLDISGFVCPSIRLSDQCFETVNLAKRSLVIILDGSL